jgi:hypothetical protein
MLSSVPASGPGTGAFRLQLALAIAISVTLRATLKGKITGMHSPTSDLSSDLRSVIDEHDEHNHQIKPCCRRMGNLSVRKRDLVCRSYAGHVLNGSMFRNYYIVNSSEMLVFFKTGALFRPCRGSVENSVFGVTSLSLARTSCNDG